MHTINIPKEYRTKEQDVRIELIKGFLNKSNLDYDELLILFNSIEQIIPSYNNYTLNDNAYAQFKEQLFESTSQEEGFNIYGSEFQREGTPGGIILDKTYNEIKAAFEQNIEIIIHVIPLGYDGRVIDVGEDQYGYYVSSINLDNQSSPIEYYPDTADDYPYMYYGT